VDLKGLKHIEFRTYSLFLPYIHVKWKCISCGFVVVSWWLRVRVTGLVVFWSLTSDLIEDMCTMVVREVRSSSFVVGLYDGDI